MVLEQFIIDADIIWDQVGKTFFENPEAKPGRIMRVQVVNAGIVEDLTGYTLNLGWTSVRDPSKFGLDAFDDVDITKGIFEIEYTSGMLTNIGPLNASLLLVPPGEGRPIESNNFKLTVKNSAINPGAIQGETSFSTLENALVEVNGWNVRIDAVEQEFKDRADALDGAYPVRLTAAEQAATSAITVANTASQKADAMAGGSPKGVYATLALLQAAYPSGTTGAYLVTADGNWYYYNGATWVSGGVYQSTGLANSSIVNSMLVDNTLDISKLNKATRQLLGSKVDNKLVWNDFALTASTLGPWTHTADGGNVTMSQFDFKGYPVGSAKGYEMMVPANSRGGTWFDINYPFQSNGHSIGDIVQYGFFISTNDMTKFDYCRPAIGETGGTNPVDFIDLKNGWYFAYGEYTLVAADIAVPSGNNGSIGKFYIRATPGSLAPMTFKFAFPMVMIGSSRGVLLDAVYTKVLDAKIPDTLKAVGLDYTMFKPALNQLMSADLNGADNTMLIKDPLLANSATVSNFNGGTGIAIDDLTIVPTKGVNLNGNMATFTLSKVAGQSTGIAIQGGAVLTDLSTGAYSVGDVLQFGWFCNFPGTHAGLGSTGVYMGTTSGTLLRPDFYSIGNGWYFAYKEYVLTASDLVKDSSHGQITAMVWRGGGVTPLSAKIATPFMTIGSQVCNVFKRILDLQLDYGASYDKFDTIGKTLLATNLLEGGENTILTSDPELLEPTTVGSFQTVGAPPTITYAKDPNLIFRGNTAQISVPAGTNGGGLVSILHPLHSGAAAVGDILQYGFCSTAPNMTGFDHFQITLGAYGAQLKTETKQYTLGNGWYYYSVEYALKAEDLINDATHGVLTSLLWRYNNTAGSQPYVFKVAFPMATIGKRACNIIARAFDARLIKRFADATKGAGSSWSGSVGIAWGDSITAINNPNSPTDSWGAFVRDHFNMSVFYGRGIGGTTVKYSSGGGSVSFINADGSHNSRNDSYNKDNYTGEVPAGTTKCRSAMCSWDRITQMIPSSIKDTIGFIFVMGGSNDAVSDGNPATFIANDVTDPEWATSEYYAVYGGDYNITSSLKGGFASMVMKFQAWCPNAVIIVGTPLSGRGTQGLINTTLGADSIYGVAQDIKQIAGVLSLPVIDVYQTSGINQLNRTTYITDMVHPYGLPGKKALARAIIGGMKGIVPNII